MLISADVNAALNVQIEHEFAASAQDVAIAAHFDCEGLFVERYLSQHRTVRDEAPPVEQES